MIKIKFSPTEFKNPIKAFDNFSKRVTIYSQQKREIEPKSFYAGLSGIREGFESQNQKDLMNRKSKNLAEVLVSLGNGKLAGIIYSLLIKMNLNKPKVIEQLAYNGLAIAKRFNDHVHIMARCEDLSKVLTDEAQKLKILKEEKKALKYICKNYDGAQNRFQTISREMKPLKNYKLMLVSVKLRIAKLVKGSDPNHAINELTEAKTILEEVHSQKYLKEINDTLGNLK